jgi:hypothetical protein
MCFQIMDTSIQKAIKLDLNINYVRENGHTALFRRVHKIAKNDYYFVLSVPLSP